MPIASSSFSLGPVQKDGRRYVSERHTDSTGEVHAVEYLASNGAGHAAIMAARALEISDALADDEAVRIANGA
jgi:hypothetical protein